MREFRLERHLFGIDKVSKIYFTETSSYVLTRTISPLLDAQNSPSEACNCKASRGQRENAGIDAIPTARETAVDGHQKPPATENAARPPQPHASHAGGRSGGPRTSVWPSRDRTSGRRSPSIDGRLIPPPRTRLTPLPSIQLRKRTRRGGSS